MSSAVAESGGSSAAATSAPARPSLDVLRQKIAAVVERRAGLGATILRLEQRALAAEQRLWDIGRLPLRRLWYRMAGPMERRARDLNARLQATRRELGECVVELDEPSDVGAEAEVPHDPSFAALAAAFDDLRRAELWHLPVPLGAATRDPQEIVPAAIARDPVRPGRSNLPFLKARQRSLRFPMPNGADLHIYPDLAVVRGATDRCRLLAVDDLTVRAAPLGEPDHQQDGAVAKVVRYVQERQHGLGNGGQPAEEPGTQYGTLTILGPTGVLADYLCRNAAKAEAFATAFARHQGQPRPVAEPTVKTPRTPVPAAAAPKPVVLDPPPQPRPAPQPVASSAPPIERPRDRPEAPAPRVEPPRVLPTLPPRPVHITPPAPRLAQAAAARPMVEPSAAPVRRPEPEPTRPVTPPPSRAIPAEAKAPTTAAPPRVEPPVPTPPARPATPIILRAAAAAPQPHALAAPAPSADLPTNRKPEPSPAEPIIIAAKSAPPPVAPAAPANRKAEPPPSASPVEPIVVAAPTAPKSESPPAPAVRPLDEPIFVAAKPAAAPAAPSARPLTLVIPARSLSQPEPTILKADSVRPIVRPAAVGSAPTRSAAPPAARIALDPPWPRREPSLFEDEAVGARTDTPIDPPPLVLPEPDRVLPALRPSWWEPWRLRPIEMASIAAAIGGLAAFIYVAWPTDRSTAVALGKIPTAAGSIASAPTGPALRAPTGTPSPAQNAAAPAAPTASQPPPPAAALPSGTRVTMPTAVRQTVMVRTAKAKLRRAPSASAKVVRTELKGRRYNVFTQRGEWVQVGTEEPLGWMHVSALQWVMPWR